MLSKIFYGIGIAAIIAWLVIKTCNGRPAERPCKGSMMFWFAIGAFIFGAIFHMRENPALAEKVVNVKV